MKNSIFKKGLKAALVVGGVCALIPSVYGQGIGIRTFERSVVPTERALERGKRLYADQCASCHGADGLGQTPVGRQTGTPSIADAAALASGSGPVAIFNVVSKGTASGKHPIFNNLYFQDQFAVAHYARTLVKGAGADTAADLEQARFEAQFGVCNANVRGTVSAQVEPRGDEQLAKGKELYEINCVSCHGAGGRGDGAGAAALNPKPRNFAEPATEWTNGASPLAVFNTLSVGIAGTSMPSYGHLSEDDRWALTHFLLTRLTPDNVRQESSEDQIDAVCRSLSLPPRPPSIPVTDAMKLLVADAGDARSARLTKYGEVVLETGADAVRGKALFQQNCASCHGDGGKGARNVGPFGSFPPFIYLTVGQLAPASAGGEYTDFARRSFGGAHATLPVSKSTALLTSRDWQNLQAYVAGFEGDGSDTVRTKEPLPAPASDEQAPEGAAAP